MYWSVGVIEVGDLKECVGIVDFIGVFRRNDFFFLGEYCFVVLDICIGVCIF